MQDFEIVDSIESVANPSPLIGSIRSLVKFAPVLAALLAVSACNKDGNNPELQAKLRACQIDSAKIEGILSGLNVDRAKLEGDSDSSGDSNDGRLHACEVRKARLIGLSQGVGIDRRQFKLKLEAVGLGELVLDVPYDDDEGYGYGPGPGPGGYGPGPGGFGPPSAPAPAPVSGPQTPGQIEDNRNADEADKIMEEGDDSNLHRRIRERTKGLQHFENTLPSNLKGKGFYKEANGTIRRENNADTYEIRADGLVVYTNKKGEKLMLLPNKDPSIISNWTKYTEPAAPAKRPRNFNF